MTVTARRRSGARASRPGAARPGTREHLSHPDRVAQGKDARAVAPLESHAEFSADRGRDPVGLLLGQAGSRVPELVPVQNERDHAAFQAAMKEGKVEATTDIQDRTQSRAPIPGNGRVRGDPASRSPGAAEPHAGPTPTYGRRTPR